MALPDLTGLNIEDTYQRVLHTDGTYIWDGTGSLVTLQYTGSLFGTASWAISASQAISASYVLTASYALNTEAAGNNYQVQFNIDDTLEASPYFTFNNDINSLIHGLGLSAYGSQSHAEGYSAQTAGDYSHTEGNQTSTGIFSYNSSNIVNGVITLNVPVYPDVTVYFISDSFLILEDANFDYIYGIVKLKVSQSYYDSGTSTTIIELYDTSINTSQANIATPSFGASPLPGADIRLGRYSHAEGNITQTIGEGSHTEGINTETIGYYSHAEGDGTQAIGYASHAEGTFTQAVGGYSHTEGNTTQAIGDYSHAEGLGTITSGSYQHAQGQYNLSSSAQSAFIIGNGIDINNRSNLVFASGSQFQVTGSLLVSGSIDGTINGGTF
jgi:hypothetical protein